MDLNYLREFVVLAETGNFLEAAEQLFISQSTLSKHIQHVEAELGVSLFHRTTRRVEVSQYGKLLLPYAEQMLHLQGRYTRELRAKLAKEQNCLEIGSIPALAPYRITDVMMQFKKECAHIRLNITQAGSTELKELLRAGSCELAFVREIEPPADHLARIPFDRDVLVAVLPANHRYAGDGAIPLSLLQDEEFLFIGQNTMLYTLCVEACVKSGFEPRIAFTDHKLEHLIDFVQKGMGVALLMNRLVAYHNNPHIAVVGITPETGTVLNLCYPRGKKLSPAAKLFVKCAKKLPGAI